MKKWSVNKEEHENALHELLIAEVGSDYALILKKEREKMTDPDVKLDREILTKIYNKLHVQSETLHYLECKIDNVIDGLVETNKIIADDMEIKDYKYRIMDMIHAQENEIHKLNIRFDKQPNEIKELERKVDYVINALVNHIDDHSSTKDHTKRNDLIRYLSLNRETTKD